MNLFFSYIKSKSFFPKIILIVFLISSYDIREKIKRKILQLCLNKYKIILKKNK